MHTRRSQACDSSPPNKKIRKLVGRDNISNLHDSIIKHVLSRLPTKEAVQTSILSTNWRFKWHSSYYVNITDVGWDRVPELFWKYFMFPDIYEKIFLHNQVQIGKSGDLLTAIRSIPLSHNVRSFNLCWWGTFYQGLLTTWTSAVLNHYIETFRLVYPWTCFVLPTNLLGCTSLKILELKVQTVWKVPAIVDGFSNLVDLSLHSVQILNEDLGCDTLTFNFKVLETLKLYYCKFSKLKVFEIHAPALTTFKWFCCHGDVWDEIARLSAVYNSHLIKIFGAQLTCFEIQDSLRYLPESTIARATLRCFVSDQHDNFEVRNLFEDTAAVNHLMLHSNTINGIIIKPPNQLRSFHRLERLAIQFLGNLEGLLELLHATPNLRFLEMDRWTLSDGELETVPSCVTFFLEEIKFNWYSYRNHQFQLEKFLLKNATQLKKITLQFRTRLRKSESGMQIQQLSTCPRAASASLETVLIWNQWI